MALRFTAKDDFNSIIHRTLNVKNSIRISIIPAKHGKSSFVFFVKVAEGEYLFKFPRTKFQARYIAQEKTVSDYIRECVSCAIPQMQIGQIDGRSFTYYKTINGTLLSDVRLSWEDSIHLCKQLVNLLCSIWSINVCELKCDLKTKKEMILDFCADFGYTPDFRIVSDIIDDDKQLIHGDFHRSNILLDENNELKALLDFATFSRGSIYFDIGHMCFSMNEKFSRIFIAECEKQLGCELDKTKIKRVVVFLDELINKHYLPFIKHRG